MVFFYRYFSIQVKRLEVFITYLIYMIIEKNKIFNDRLSFSYT